MGEAYLIQPFVDIGPKVAVVPTASYGASKQGGDTGNVSIITTDFTIKSAVITFTSSVNYGDESRNSPRVTSQSYSSGQTVTFEVGTYDLGTTRVDSSSSGYCYLTLQLIVASNGIYYRVYDPGSKSWAGRSSQIWQSFGGKAYSKILV